MTTTAAYRVWRAIFEILSDYLKRSCHEANFVKNFQENLNMANHEVSIARRERGARDPDGFSKVFGKGVRDTRVL